MLKIYLRVIIGAFLIKFIRDAESKNELLLAFIFSILFGCYIGNCIVSYLLCKRNKKISVKLNL